MHFSALSEVVWNIYTLCAVLRINVNDILVCMSLYIRSVVSLMYNLVKKHATTRSDSPQFQMSRLRDPHFISWAHVGVIPHIRKIEMLPGFERNVAMIGLWYTQTTAEFGDRWVDAD